MNSVKYSKWKDAVRAHQPGGFNSEAAWEKFQQLQPRRKKKRWLPWLAAACLCGIVFSLFMMKESGNKTIAKKNNAVQPVNHISIQQKELVTGNNLIRVLNKETMPGKQPVATFLPAVKPVHPKPVQNIPAEWVQLLPENKPLPVAEHVPSPVAAIQPKEETKAAVKPAMRIVHLNELSQQQPEMAQQMPPEERTAPKFPLSKPGYAKNNSDEQQQPEIKQRKGFGLPRSLASLKD